MHERHHKDQPPHRLVRLAVLGRDRRRLCALPAALDATAVATVATPAPAASEPSRTAASSTPAYAAPLL